MMPYKPISSGVNYTHPAGSGPIIGSFGGNVDSWGAGYFGPGDGPSLTSPPQTISNAATAGFTGGTSGPSAGDVTNLPAIDVSAYLTPSISPPSGIGSYSSSASTGSNSGGGGQIPGIDVKNFVPVHVTAQAPVTPSWYDTLNMAANDHPLATQAIGASIPMLGPVFSVAHAIWNAQHGVSPLGSLSNVLSGIGNLFSGGGSGSAPQSSAASSLNPLLATTPNSMGAGGNGASTGNGGILTGAPLPDYAGLGALGNFGSAPVGGYWNQQAIHMANPTYGPYASIGSQPAPQAGPTISPISGMTQPKPLGSPMPFAPFGRPHPINDNNPYAPSGITTAGY